MPKALPHQVLLKTDRPTFPNRCASCLGPAEAEHRPTPPGRGQGLPASEPLSVPYCRGCLESLAARQSMTTRALVAANIWIWGSLAGSAVAGLLASAAVFAPVAAAIYVPAWLRHRGKPPKGPAVEALWYRRTTYLFSFSNEEYAKEFREANIDMLYQEGR